MTDEDLDTLLATLRKHGVTQFVTQDGGVTTTIVMGPPPEVAQPVVLPVSQNLSADDIRKADDEGDLYAAVR